MQFRNYEEIQNMLMSELTVDELVTLFFSLFIMCCIIGLIGFFIIKVVDFILDLILYCTRKDKYKSKYNFDVLRSLRYISRLRKQVINAPTEKAYFLYYNRLLGAALFLGHMGYINPKSPIMTKILDVRGKFEYNSVRNKIYEYGLSIKEGVPGAGLSEEAVHHFYSDKSDDDN